MTGLFDKFSKLLDIQNTYMEEMESHPLNMRIEKIITPTQAVIAGKERVMLGTNNYLGLTMDETSIEHTIETVQNFGTGTTGSRVANGSYSIHQDLERSTAEFFGKKHAILFTTGYQANVGFISAIAGRDDYVLIDADCHASIYDGCKLGDATVIRFKHNDAADLEKRLSRLPADAAKLVVIEGIYSMLGDRAPLADIVSATKKHGAYLMVDEAHSVGVLGENGRGLAEEAGLEDEIDFIVGTFSKSVGTIGGYCVSNHPELDISRFAARAYLFTASLPPAVVTSAQSNLNIMSSDKGRALIKKLWANTDRIYDGLKSMGFQVGPEKTPVIGVLMPGVEQAVRAWQILLENDLYVNMALPPATPGGISLLRCSVCAAHTDEQIDLILSAFKAVSDELGAQIAEKKAA